MHRDEASLRDIYQAGKAVVAFAKDSTREVLENDNMKLSAVAYQILTLGEATTRLSTQIRADNPDIPWRGMVGMRNIMAHQYDNIDMDIMWNAISISIPEILEKIEPLLS